MSVTHIGKQQPEIAAILDLHLSHTVAWKVQWLGAETTVTGNGGSFTIASGRVWGPYSDTANGRVPEVVREAFAAVRGPLTDRLFAKMTGG